MNKTLVVNIWYQDHKPTEGGVQLKFKKGGGVGGKTNKIKKINQHALNAVYKWIKMDDPFTESLQPP